MATIAILTHEYGGFAEREYLVKGLARHGERLGHRIMTARGLPPKADADVAILHVDVSVVPEDYMEFASQFPVVVNGAVRDIRKRAISGALLGPGDDWSGPVIVKANLNRAGWPERQHNRIAAMKGRPAPYDVAAIYDAYPIYPSIASVPGEVWEDPDRVAERFIPERDRSGFWIRTWTFFGDRERCSRYCSPNPIVKASDVIAREPSPVPDDLRAERARLGFDYGKFDFVLDEGRAVLLDANRTPGAPPDPSGRFARTTADLARGIDLFLRSAA